MNYRVTWRRRAKDELAQVWLNAADRNAVTAAANRIESVLERDPLMAGESRDAGFRIIYDGPLTSFTKRTPKTGVSSSSPQGRRFVGLDLV